MSFQPFNGILEKKYPGSNYYRVLRTEASLWDCGIHFFFCKPFLFKYNTQKKMCKTSITYWDEVESETCEPQLRSRTKTLSALQKLFACSFRNISNHYLLGVTTVLNFIVITFMLCFIILAPIDASLDITV